MKMINRHVFISHSSKDAKIASELCEFFEKNGKKCFIAPRDISAGKEYAEEIINGIDSCKSMILILSENSNDSPHVLREVERAVSKSIPIVIYRLEEVELSKSLEYFLMTNQWIDAKKNIDFEGVLNCVNQALNGTYNSIKDNVSIPSDSDKAGAGKSKFGIKSISIVAVIALIIFVAGIGIKMYSDDKSDKKNSKSVNNNLSNNNVSNNQEGNNVVENNAGNSKNLKDAIKDIKVGDTVTFGRYQGKEIEWRVLKMSDDKKEAVLVSKYILCMKAYDAAESGKYNVDKEGNSYYGQSTEADTNMELQVLVRGNSDWSVSNIRTWLNSSDEVVKYEDQAPALTAMSEHKNGYNTEPGFLHDFTDEERDIIVETDKKTKANALSDKDTVTTKDKVYLLSLDELKWFEDAGIQVLAEPDDKALETDKTYWFNTLSGTYNIKEYYWWLRDATKEHSSMCYMVGNGYTQENIFEKNVGLEGYGIRPALTVSLS